MLEQRELECELLLHGGRPTITKSNEILHHTHPTFRPEQNAPLAMVAAASLTPEQCVGEDEHGRSHPGIVYNGGGLTHIFSALAVVQFNLVLQQWRH